MDTLIAQLDLYFGKKAPQLPANVKEGIVRFGPYVIVIVLILSALGLLALLPLALGMGAAYGMAGYGGYGMMYGAYGSMTGIYISLIVSIAVVILEAMAIKGLFKRTAQSWKLIFYACCVSLIGSLLHLNLIGFIIGAIIGFYILFQIKALYNGIVPAVKAPHTPPAPTA